MTYRVIACGVFEPYLRALAEESPHDVDLRVLDAGLHARPNDLRILSQAEIDEASRDGSFDAVILFYGLCGRGTAGLIARDIPVVIPRAHDCITMFLGSSDEYRRQFARHPGTFYGAMGWLEKSTHPRHRDAAPLYHDYLKEGYRSHPSFPALEERYGGDNAEKILEFLDRWKRNYTRAAYIDLGFEGEEESAAITRGMADANGWLFEKIEGDRSLLARLLSGEWDSDGIFVLPPRHRSQSTGDERILMAVPVDSAEEPAFTSGETVLVEADGEDGEGGETRGSFDDLHSRGSGIGLGIDAGGTYTDAVLYDLSDRRLLAKAKSLTTYHDLVEGIRGALAGLPSDGLARVEVTALSTTLATNAIVEGRGQKVGLIVLSPWDWFPTAIDHSPREAPPGCVDINGDVMEPLDEDECRVAIRRLVEEERCESIVIAGYGATRNPAQVNRIRELTFDLYDVPIVCAHEVSRRLDAVKGARTALMNARLLPVIRDLIGSVHRALEEFRVPGKLMVVKGDGTPVDESVARSRPIETILSGPASSVSGARILTGLDDALVIDIGGTTTDCAIIENGRAALAPDGARVGDWTMSVDVADILTVGLGGDSRIDFNHERVVTIGPARNIPLCCLSAETPAIGEFLRRFDERRVKRSHHSTAMDVLVLGAPTRMALTAAEETLVGLLREGPVPVRVLCERMGLPVPVLLPTARLEACGAVKRGGLTPTDLLHVSGRFARWDVEAARRGLVIFASMIGRPAEEVLETVLTRFHRRLYEEAIRREVSVEDRRLHDLPEPWQFLLDRGFDGSGRGLDVRFTLRRPIVAIGAPAGVMAPPIGEVLGTEIVVPEHADVANAVGAIGTEITIREEVVIAPGQSSNYVLYSTDERMEFTELERATDRAVQVARAAARKRAVEAGAASPEVTVTRLDRAGALADGSALFLERKVVAVASGSAFAPRSAPVPTKAGTTRSAGEERNR